MYAMKLILLILLIPCVAFGAGETHYVTQNGAGDSNGTTLLNAFSAANFNNAANWDTDVSDDGKIGPGDTVYFSGTITTKLEVQKSGSSGNYITLDGYEAGDLDPYNPSASAAVLSGQWGGMGIYAGQGYLIIQDLRFSVAWLQGYYYSESTQTSNVIIQRNHFYNAHQSWLAMAGYTAAYRMSYITVQNNKFENYCVGADSPQGLNLVHINDLIVRENTICHSPGISTVATSTNNVELHYLDRFIFEKNDVYGRGVTTPQLQQIQVGMTVKEYGSQNGIVRFNKFYDFQDVESRGFTVNWNTTDNIYVYGNLSYNNYNYAIDVFDGAANVYIWANLFYDNGRAGFVTWERGQGIVSNVYLYNNTIANNGGSIPVNPNGDLVPLSIKAGTNVRIKNNLIYNNGNGNSGYSQFYKPAGVTLGALEHNTYYVPGQTPQWNWETVLKTFAQMQALGYEDDAVAGAVADPSFVDASNDNFALTGSSPAIDTGEDLSATITPITIQGVAYSLDLADGLHPSFDLSDANPVNWVTATAKQGDYGSGWERGAYVYTPSRKSGMKYGFGLGL